MAEPLDVSSGVGAIPGGYGNREAHLWAALILVRHGDRGKHEGLPVLKELFFYHGKGAYWDLVGKAVRDLGISDAKQVLCGEWEPVEYNLFVPREGVLARRAFLHGCESTYQFLIRSLSSRQVRGHTFGTNPRGHRLMRVPVTQRDLTASLVAVWRTDDFRFDVMESEKDKRRKRTELATWLAERFHRIQAGERPDMR